MTQGEFKQAMENTKQGIYEVKEQLEQSINAIDEKKLQAKLKELQVRQMWYLDQVKAW